jgi:ankyrin repeat protein
MASEHGYLEIVQTLLGRGADVHHSNDYDDTALHLASSGKGTLRWCELCWRQGPERMYAGLNEYGDTPISRACQGKHMEVFRALVEAGGDVNTPDSNGDTALHHASRYGFTEGVRYLVERGADVNKSTTDEYDMVILPSHGFQGRAH